MYGIAQLTLEFIFFNSVSREQKKEKYGTEFEVQILFFTSLVRVYINKHLALVLAHCIFIYFLQGTDVQQEEDEKKTSKRLI